MECMFDFVHVRHSIVAEARMHGAKSEPVPRARVAGGAVRESRVCEQLAEVTLSVMGERFLLCSPRDHAAFRSLKAGLGLCAVKSEGKRVC